MKKRRSELSLAFSDREGVVYDFPGFEPAFRTGKRFVTVEESDLIRLPYGSYLFTLPGRRPVFHNVKNGDFNHLRHGPDNEEIFAVSSFLSSGYLRTYLPAYIKDDDAGRLSLWAYCGVVVMDGEFYVPAVRIDDDPRSDPGIHENEDELIKAIADMKKRYPGNRLVTQLATCSREYMCLCARNFFLARHEAPVPTSPSCNSDCLGCLSLQDTGSGFNCSQPRIRFLPSPEEISGIITHHFLNVDSAVASFGQGCEGEPLLRYRDLAKAVAAVREKTDRGTININTNGSMPEAVRRLVEAGIDSMRISLNSPTEKYYMKYHRPVNYDFNDLKRSIETAIAGGIFVSINLFFMPGFTDMAAEIESLYGFLREFPVNMIQTRNLNIDPDLYFEAIGFEESEPEGIMKLIERLRSDFPDIILGYYNPPRERFFQKKGK